MSSARARGRVRLGGGRAGGGRGASGGPTLVVRHFERRSAAAGPAEGAEKRLQGGVVAPRLPGAAQSRGTGTAASARQLCVEHAFRVPSAPACLCFPSSPLPRGADRWSPPRSNLPPSTSSSRTSASVTSRTSDADTLGWSASLTADPADARCTRCHLRRQPARFCAAHRAPLERRARRRLFPRRRGRAEHFSPRRHAARDRLR